LKTRSWLEDWKRMYLMSCHLNWGRRYLFPQTLKLWDRYLTFSNEISIIVLKEKNWKTQLPREARSSLIRELWSLVVSLMRSRQALTVSSSEMERKNSSSRLSNCLVKLKSKESLSILTHY
jgi:hypothetical protein